MCKNSYRLACRGDSEAIREGYSEAIRYCEDATLYKIRRKYGQTRNRSKKNKSENLALKPYVVCNSQGIFLYKIHSCIIMCTILWRKHDSV